MSQFNYILAQSKHYETRLMRQTFASIENGCRETLGIRHYTTEDHTLKDFQVIPDT